MVFDLELKLLFFLEISMQLVTVMHSLRLRCPKLLLLYQITKHCCLFLSLSAKSTPQYMFFFFGKKKM